MPKVKVKGTKQLERDFVRGVKLIRDKNYEPYANGVTKYSINFFKHLVDEGYLIPDEVYRADLEYDKKHHYRLTLHTIDEYRFSFHGVSFGYGGEGSRGSAEILKACGFNNYKRAFSEFRKHMNDHDIIRLFKKGV